MTHTGIGHPHINARSLSMAKIIVERIDPDPTLIEVAHRYLTDEKRLHGRLSQASREWKQILCRPWSEVREMLLDESGEGQRLRSSGPFAGVVTKEERFAIIRATPPPWPHVPDEPDQAPGDVMDSIHEGELFRCHNREQR